MSGRNDANHGTGARISGTIVRVTDRGFGFAVAADGREYFIHFSNCAPGAWDEICEKVAGRDGGRNGKIAVSFEPTLTSKGLRGLNVQL